MGVCHFIAGEIPSAGTYMPDGVDGNLNVLIQVSGTKARALLPSATCSSSSSR